jgi:hypothetical protein
MPTETLAEKAVQGNTTLSERQRAEQQVVPQAPVLPSLDCPSVYGKSPPV